MSDLQNVGGFAWSGMNADEAVGWISFNNAAVDGVPGGGSTTVDYGVNINQVTGAMSGNAWAAVDKDASNNPQGLGWISFDEAQLGGCPEGTNCKAWVTTTPDASGRYWVNGWARVLFADGTANSGGWNGWIHLNTIDCDKNNDGKSNINSTICPHAGDPVYGVYIDSNGDFHGFAWSDMVMGWLNFNKANCDGTNCTGNGDYKVHTSAKFVPDAIIGGCAGSSCVGGYCDNVAGSTWVMFQPIGACPDCIFKVTNASTGNVQCSKWELVGTSYGAIATGAGAKVDHTFQPDVPVGTYTLKLTVSDNAADPDCVGANSDTATHLITIKKEVAANFNCTFDDPNSTTTTPVWQDCDSATFKKKVAKDEKVYVKDVSTPSDPGNGFQIGTHNWTITPNAPVIDANGVASFSAAKSNTIKLDTIDNNSAAHTSDNVTGRHNCKSVTVGAKSLPQWKEISPVGMIWNYLVANVSKILATR